MPNEFEYEEALADIEEESKEEFLQAVFDISEIIELLKNHKIESLESIKGSLLNIDVILNYFQKNYDNRESFLELKNYLSKEHQVITELVERNASSEEVLLELQSMLDQVNNFYRNVISTDSDINKKDETSRREEYYEDYDKAELDIDPLVIPDLDKLYKRLYNAISTNNVRKETTYRGRIIRKLRDYKILINEKYEQVRILDVIKSLLLNNNIEEIKELLLKEDNKKYYDYFMGSVNSFVCFTERFNELCQRPDIAKIMFYHEALQHELNEQSKKLSERYSKEFLDKRTGLTSVVTTLPTAVGLSIQKLSNTITEMQEARTRRKKVVKLVESIKDTGRVIATPFTYIGKFAINNWYALYSLYKGFNTAKVLEASKKQEYKNQLEEVKPEEVKPQVPVDEESPVEEVKPSSNHQLESRPSALGAGNILVDDANTGKINNTSGGVESVAEKPTIIKPSYIGNQMEMTDSETGKTPQTQTIKPLPEKPSYNLTTNLENVNVTDANTRGALELDVDTDTVQMPNPVLKAEEEMVAIPPEFVGPPVPCYSPNPDNPFGFDCPVVYHSWNDGGTLYDDGYRILFPFIGPWGMITQDQIDYLNTFRENQEAAREGVMIIY